MFDMQPEGGRTTRKVRPGRNHRRIFMSSTFVVTDKNNGLLIVTARWTRRGYFHYHRSLSLQRNLDLKRFGQSRDAV